MMCLGIPGRIINISGAGLTASGCIDFAGAQREVSLAYVPEATVGDFVIVHAGFALTVLDAEEAETVLADLHAWAATLEPTP